MVTGLTNTRKHSDSSPALVPSCGDQTIPTTLLAAPLEKHAQRALFDWMTFTRYNGEPIGKYAFAIPNGAHLFGTAGQRSAQMAGLRKQGLRVGLPDVMIAIPVEPFHGLFIEMKRDKSSKIADNQREWQDRLRKQGYRAEIAAGYDAAVIIICQYLGLVKAV